MELLLCNVVKLSTRELRELGGVLSSFRWVWVGCLRRARMVDDCRRPLIMSGATPDNTLVMRLESSSTAPKGTPNRRVPSRRPSPVCGRVAKVGELE